jgi:hypothetical protein
MDINLADFAFWAAIVGGVLSPTVFQFIKNWGGNWPKSLKIGIAVVFAAGASFVAIGTGAGWEVLDYGSWTMFWQPLIGGMVVTFPVQYASYSVFIDGTTAGEKLGNVTAFNSDPVVYSKAA